MLYDFTQIANVKLETTNIYYKIKVQFEFKRLPTRTVTLKYMNKILTRLTQKYLSVLTKYVTH